jgi:heme A synthase
VLAYNIAVILWGAYVRISFSGDGCGANWPFCSGQVIPQHMAAPMAIEFTHRIMTSVDTFAVIALVLWAFISFSSRSPVRRYALWSLFFLFVEALLGAGLVLFRKVAHDQSAGRIWYLSGHLVNTLLLIGTLAATAWLATARMEKFRIRWISFRSAAVLIVAIIISVTGAIAALGDTLFPVSSLTAGMRQDFAASSAALLRLRMLHPLAALLGASFIIWTAHLSRRRPGAPHLRRAATLVIAVILLQIGVGICNLALLAPVWMQLFHLLTADIVWIAIGVMVLESAYVDAGEPIVSRQDHSYEEREQDSDRMHAYRHLGA